VTREAIGRGVILPVTVNAVSHLQVSDLLHHLHATHVTVARGTVNAGAYVGFVEELNVVGEAVDSFPLNRVAVIEVRPEEFEFLAPGEDELLIAQVLVAEETLLNGGYSGGSAGIYSAVTEHALNADFFDMYVVGKVDGLLGSGAHAKYLERFGEYGFRQEYRSQDQDYSNTKTYNRYEYFDRGGHLLNDRSPVFLHGWLLPPAGVNVSERAFRIDAHEGEIGDDSQKSCKRDDVKDRPDFGEVIRQVARSDEGRD
jgi:hypothetical protein